jgi:hypothetical protein
VQGREQGTSDIGARRADSALVCRRSGIYDYDYCCAEDENPHGAEDDAAADPKEGGGL